MKYRTRIYYSEEQKSLMWDRWQKGDVILLSYRGIRWTTIEKFWLFCGFEQHTMLSIRSECKHLWTPVCAVMT